MNPKQTLIIYTDGGSRGNPGYAAYGFVVFDSEKKLLAEVGKNIGIQTNNVAEYSAILEALKYVETINHKPSTINFFMDSKLCAEQLSGNWKIKNENLRGFYYEIKKMEAKLGVKVTYSHVPREQNKEADRMVNLALDNLL
jgi:ribonuclease HI